MKVLVTGANGQLGMTIRDKANEFPSLNFAFVNRDQLDIQDKIKVNAFFAENHFDYCVNCAAYTNVDGAETEKELAFKINAEGAENLALACKAKKTTLIHISTDYVFDGISKTPYLETDIVNPINIYGNSKLKGEELVQNHLENYFIIRTSWLYSVHGKNFVKTIVKKIQQDSELTITTSQVGTPTSCADLSDFIIKIINSKSNDYGLYHFSGRGETTWYGFAQQIASNFKGYKIDKIKAVNHYKSVANRPAYSVMNNTKASHLINITKWEESVNKAVKVLKY